MLSLAFRTAFLLNWSNASLRMSERTKNSISGTYSTGFLLFAFAFLIWNLDNIFCDTLTKWKTEIGWPAAFALEGAIDAYFSYPIIDVPLQDTPGGIL
jgi:dihydroceramidase